MQPQKMHMNKKQFRIGDLAQELKVKKFVIRFWEKEFDLKSDRSGGGQRFYTSDDLKMFLLIKDLLYNQGFTIAGAKKQLEGAEKPNIAADEPIKAQEVSTNQSQPDALLPEPMITPAKVIPCDCDRLIEKLGSLKEQLAELKGLLERSTNR